VLLWVIPRFLTPILPPRIRTNGTSLNSTFLSVGNPSYVVPPPKIPQSPRAIPPDVQHPVQPSSFRKVAST
jgi:hypothetical protein